MIYRNSDVVHKFHWWPESNSEAGAIAHSFLAGELDLLRFTGTRGDVVRDLSAFLEAADGLPLTVRRAASGELLVSAGPWDEALLLTGRTADVLRAYIDDRLVRMEDRFDMTVRRAVRAV